jgi:hypothetical protein
MAMPRYDLCSPEKTLNEARKSENVDPNFSTSVKMIAKTNSEPS